MDYMDPDVLLLLNQPEGSTGMDSHAWSHRLGDSGGIWQIHLPESPLTHSGLVTPYGDRDLGEHWLR